MSAPRVAHSVFCDDVRLEAGNKISLMGIYAQEIVFGGPKPGFLPKFCVVAWLICDPDDVPAKATIRVNGPDQKELLRAEIGPVAIQTREDSTKTSVRVLLQGVGLLVDNEGDLEVYIDTDREILRAARLQVKFIPAEAAVESKPAAA